MATEADDAQLSKAAFDSSQYYFDSPPSACLGPTDLELFGDVLCWAAIVGWHRDGEMAEAVKFWRQKALALQKRKVSK